MKAFFDTSVLVATFYGDHEHHEASMSIFLRFAKREACCGAHTLAEVYSVLTGMPGKDRVSGDEALLFLANIRERLSIVSLSQDDYFKATAECAELGVTGGGIYDALHAHCARKGAAETIYTWNVKHFRRFGPETAGRVTTP